MKGDCPPELTISLHFLADCANSEASRHAKSNYLRQTRCGRMHTNQLNGNVIIEVLGR